MTPDEQRKTHGICPVCKRHVTDGVMRRVQELADDELRIKNQELRVKTKNNAAGLQWLIDPRGLHPPFVKLVPLNEIISEAIGSPVASPKVKVIYDLLCKKLRSELNVLLKAPIEEIKEIARSVSSGQGVDKVSEGIEKVRKANIVIKPGYDGLYGVVKIWPEDNDKGLMINDKEKSVSNEVSDDPKKQIGLEF